MTNTKKSGEDAKTTRQFRGRLIAGSAFRLPPNGTMALGIQAANGPCKVDISTSYESNARGEQIPLGLVFDFTDFRASDLSEAIAGMEQAVGLLLPPLAFTANAAYDDPRVVLVYDADDASDDHPMQLSIVELTFEAEKLGSRLLPAALALAVLNGFMTHDRVLQISRALVNYNEALTHWGTGRELRSVLALWVCLENLSPIAVELCVQAGGTKEKLAEEWKNRLQVRKCPACGHVLPVRDSDLEAAARCMVILNGDQVTYKQANDISNGYEHGFENFPALHAKAKECRDELMRLSRAFLLNVLSLPVPAKDQLTEDPYGKPLRRDEATIGFQGTLNGPAAGLAPEGQLHPVITPSVSVARAQIHDDGRVTKTMTTKLDVNLGEGVQLRDYGLTGSDRIIDAKLDHMRLDRADGTSFDLLVEETPEPSDADS